MQRALPAASVRDGAATARADAGVVTRRTLTHCQRLAPLNDDGGKWDSCDAALARLRAHRRFESMWLSHGLKTKR
ncbi:hypothetical protein KCP73_15295 [Salmonella enterica subsp. enterica]|nr:hypothetical protein KCP73_15295 [Salmonella enterica subsp. enterica]